MSHDREIRLSETFLSSIRELFDLREQAVGWTF
jgi:hypothetical protein